MGFRWKETFFFVVRYNNPIKSGTPFNQYKMTFFFLLLRRFCESSTIHGTFFWSESATIWGKIIWVAIVVIGISGSGWIIDNSFKVKTNLSKNSKEWHLKFLYFKAWADAPVITSVEQILIEQVPFPAITVCPLENTR